MLLWPRGARFSAATAPTLWPAKAARRRWNASSQKEGPRSFAERSNAGGSPPWRFLLSRLRHFHSFRFCWQRAPCSIPEKNSSRPSRSAAAFATPSSPLSDSATATTSCVSFLATTNPRSPSSSLWPSSARYCRWFNICATGRSKSVTRKSNPAPVDHITLTRNPRAIIRSEKQYQPRHLPRHQLALQALALHDLGQIFRGHPQPPLTFRHDGPGRHTIHADVGPTQFSRERAREANDSRLRGHVSREPY